MFYYNFIIVTRVVNETYDAETEMRPRWDVQNNVSRRSVETFMPWLVI